MCSRLACVMVSLAIAIFSARTARAQGAFWDGGGSTPLWNNPANWDLNNIPGPDFTVQIYEALTQLDADFTIRTLLLRGFNISGNVANSPDVGATSFDLNITQELNYFDPGGNVTVYGPSLSAGRILLNNGSSLHLNSEKAVGTAVVRTNLVGPSFAPSLNNPVGGTIQGNGRIELNASIAGPTTLFNNAGTLTAGSFSPAANPPSTDLRITAVSSNARVGLFGVVNVLPNAELEIQPLLNGPFNSTLNLARGSTFRMTHDWSMSGGSINVNTEGSVPGIAGAEAELEGGELSMTGGTISLDALDRLALDAELTATGGTINNAGQIVIRANSKVGQGVDFNMIGPEAKLIVGADLTIDSPDFDLDAANMAGNQTFLFPFGNLDLTLGAGADTTFNHRIEFVNVANLAGELDVKTASNTWGLGSGGVIFASGLGTSVINGETLQVFDNAVITVTGSSQMDLIAPVQFLGASFVNISAGAVLNLASATFGNDVALYSGGGTLRPGNANVTADTAWNVTNVDLDDGNPTLNALLIINAATIDPSGDGFDGSMIINEGGQLRVNLTGGGWAVDEPGSIDFNGDTIDSDVYLAGAPVALNGRLKHAGFGQTYARLAIGSTGAVNMSAVSIMTLNGGNDSTNPNTIAGGTIDGEGVLLIPAGRALRGFGEIKAAFQTNGKTLADDGVLRIYTASFSGGDTLGTADKDGILEFTTPWNTNQVLNVVLLEGELRGATITNGGLGGINGSGLVSAQVFNNTHIDAENGPLLLLNNPANNNDWDGSNNQGELNALSGDLELRDNASFLFSGVVRVENGRSVFANGFELEFEPISLMRLHSGTYRSTHTTEFGGLMTVFAGAPSTLAVQGNPTFQAGAVFENGSITVLNSDLILNNTPGTTIRVNADFIGIGDLIVNNGTLRLLQGVNSGDLAVGIENRSFLDLGTVVTAAQVSSDGDYRQTTSGALVIDLGGAFFDGSDRLDVTGEAFLGGGLFLNLIDDYVPELGQTILILDAVEGVEGTFSTVNQPAAMPPGLGFEVMYDPNSVSLKVVSTAGFSADFDNDGDVDGTDFNVWQRSFGENGGADSDLDLDSDGADFLAWQRQLGSGLAVPAGASIPEPKSLVLVASLLGVVVAVHRRWLMVS